MNAAVSRNELYDVVDWFKELFPAAFPRKAKAVKPLQLGIIEQILDIYDRLDYPPFSKKKLRAGLNFYTSSKAYLKAQCAGAFRVDLYGNEETAVTEEQAQYAQEKLAERFPKASLEEDAAPSEVLQENSDSTLSEEKVNPEQLCEQLDNN